MYLEPEQIGIIGMIIILVFLIIRVPIGITLGIVGFLGIFVIAGADAAWNSVYALPYLSCASWMLSVLPMFILMGLG